MRGFSVLSWVLVGCGVGAGPVVLPRGETSLTWVHQGDAAIGGAIRNELAKQVQLVGPGVVDDSAFIGLNVLERHARVCEAARTSFAVFSRAELEGSIQIGKCLESKTDLLAKGGGSCARSEPTIYRARAKVKVTVLDVARCEPVAELSRETRTSALAEDEARRKAISATIAELRAPLGNLVVVSGHLS